MAQYVFYQVHLSRSQQTNIHLQHTDGTSLLEHAQEHFGSYFKGRMLNLYKKDKNGEVTLVPNDILRQIDEVTVLRINNEQLKTLVKKVERPGGGIPDYREEKQESYPFSHVVIDNRPGICQMAIEKSSTWNGSTDTVRDILQEWFKVRLSDDYGLDISIDQKWQESEFWEFVEHRCRNTGDVLKEIKFDMLNSDHVTPVRNTEEPLSGFVKAMTDMTRMMDMLKTTVVMEPKEDSSISRTDKYEDLAQMVRLCSNNSYHLSVRFSNYGWYKSNEWVKAMFELPVTAFSNFVNGSPAMSPDKPEGEYELVQWLDDVIKETEQYKDGNKTKRKTKKGAKK